MEGGARDAERPAGDLEAALGGWAADARIAEAGAARARERWLRQQATEEATLVGLLSDLAERRAEVVVTTASGRHPGRLVGVGQDFCAVGGGPGTTLIGLQAIATVATSGTPGPAAGDRGAPLPQRFNDALAALAAERSPVRLHLRSGQALTGELTAVGADVLSLRLDGIERRLLHVALSGVESCTSR